MEGGADSLRQRESSLAGGRSLSEGTETDKGTVVRVKGRE